MERDPRSRDLRNAPKARSQVFAFVATVAFAGTAGAGLVFLLAPTLGLDSGEGFFRTTGLRARAERDALGARLLETLARPESLPSALGADPRLRACFDRPGTGNEPAPGRDAGADSAPGALDCVRSTAVPLLAPEGALFPFGARTGSGGIASDEGAQPFPYDAQGRACAPTAPVDECPYEIEARLSPRCEGDAPACARASSFAFEVEVRFRAPPGGPTGGGLSRRVRALPPLSATVVVDARALESILYETARAAAPLPKSISPGNGSDGRRVSGDGRLPTLRSAGAGAVLPVLPGRPGRDPEETRRARPPKQTVPKSPEERAESE